MEGKITKISYNEKDDILFIYKEGRVKGNITMGGFIVDTSYRNDVIGIEVLDACKNLEVFHITKEMMKHVKRARLISKKYPDGTIFTGFELLSTIPNKEKEERAAIVAIPEISAS